MSLIVAVDGGGSRCRLVAFEPDGQERSRVVVDAHASLSRSTAAAWQHIDQGLQQLRRNLSLPDDWLPQHLVMGLAGSLQEERREEFLKRLPVDLPRTLVTDGHAQLFGASAGAAGICLALGTGSVLHWKAHDGSLGMVGGWGFPVGDEGSGAWLGMRLVQSYLWHVDGRRQPGTLMDALTERLGDQVSQIQCWSTQTQSGVLATLAPLVFEHAARGDALAESLQREALEQALALLSLAPESLPVHVVGGIGEALKPLLAAALGERLQAARGDALQGLWRMWRDSEGADEHE